MGGEARKLLGGRAARRTQATLRPATVRLWAPQVFYGRPPLGSSRLFPAPRCSSWLLLAPITRPHARGFLGDNIVPRQVPQGCQRGPQILQNPAKSVGAAVWLRKLPGDAIEVPIYLSPRPCSKPLRWNRAAVPSTCAGTKFLFQAPALEQRCCSQPLSWNKSLSSKPLRWNRAAVPSPLEPRGARRS